MEKCELGSEDGVHCNRCDGDRFPLFCLKMEGAEVVHITDKEETNWYILAALIAIQVIIIVVTVTLCLQL